MRSRCLVADGRYPRLFSSSPGSLMSQFLSHLGTISIVWHFVLLICKISSLRMAFITESLFRSWREKDWLNDFSANNTSLCWWFTQCLLRLLTECFQPHRGCCSLRVALLTQADLPVRVENFQDGAEHGQTSSHRTYKAKNSDSCQPLWHQRHFRHLGQTRYSPNPYTKLLIRCGLISNSIVGLFYLSEIIGACNNNVYALRIEGFISYIVNRSQWFQQRELRSKRDSTEDIYSELFPTTRV